MNIHIPDTKKGFRHAAEVLCRFTPCRMTYNEITLYSRTGSTPSQILADYNRGLQAHADAYAASAEGVAVANKRRAEIDKRQAVVNELVARLPSLTLSNPTEALGWLEEFRIAANDVAVKPDLDAIFSAFNEAGWVENDCTRHPDVETDPVIFARWLVGWALAGIRLVGVPHPSLRDFYEQWKEMTAS